ncbi:hypothetical protein ACQKGC_28875 [Allorhizobium pseudoryzae]|uniref:hypothetical protein n=1 Tax=Allorhizobium pseudoryzae TaxID=379684 RepID=UPI003CFFB7A4
MAKTRQTISDVKIGGDIGQTSDSSSVHQSVTKAEGASLTQRNQSQKGSLVIGRNKAVGWVAVSALAIVAIIFIYAKYIN